MTRRDINAPHVQAVPFWGPDASSRRLTALNVLFASSMSPANIGIGVRTAPGGASFTEGTKSDTWLAPQQNFRGFVGKVADPDIKNTLASASLPSANTQINPLLMMMSAQQLNPGGILS